MANTVKVHVSFSDGHYSMEPFTDEHAKAGLTSVEITERQWDAYRAFCQDDRRWHEFMRDLDNEQYAKDSPQPRS